MSDRTRAMQSEQVSASTPRLTLKNSSGVGRPRGIHTLWSKPARWEQEAERMRKEAKPRRGLLVGGYKPSSRPKTAIERQAIESESRRRNRYAVICECYGETIVFGYSAEFNGGAALAFAKIVPWADNPRVMAR